MPRGTYVHAGGAAERFHCAPGPGGWRYVAEGDAGTVDLTVDSRWRQIRVQVTAGGWRVRGGVSGGQVLWVRSPAGAGSSAGSAGPPGSGGAAGLAGPGGAAGPAGSGGAAGPAGSGGTADPAGSAGTAGPGGAAGPAGSGGAAGRARLGGAADPAGSGGAAGSDDVGGADTVGAGGGSEYSAPAAGFLGSSPGFLVAVARSLGMVEGQRTDVRLVELTGPALAALTVSRRWELAGVSVYDTELGPLPVQRYEVTDLATGERGSVHLAGDVVVAAPGIELVDLDGPPSGVVTA